MIIAFRSLFSSQDEGGAKLAGGDAVSLRTTSRTAAVLVLDASARCFPNSGAMPLTCEPCPSRRYWSQKGKRLLKRVVRRLRKRSWEDPAITRFAAAQEVDLGSPSLGSTVSARTAPASLFPDFQCRYFPELFAAGGSQP